MIRTVLSIVVMVAVMAQAQAAETARKLICPPELSYCYYVEKPIRSSLTLDDITKSIDRVEACLNNPFDRGDCSRYLPSMR